MAVKLDLKNKIINGSMEYWQRGTSFSAFSGGYFADRWNYAKSGTMVHTLSRSTDVPSGAFGVYSILATCTTAQASLTSAQYCVIEQKIEGNVLRTFKGKSMVLSFWVKAFKAGTYCVAFKNWNGTAQDKSLIKEFTINASNTWENKIIRIKHDSSGTWQYDTGIGMSVTFSLAGGSNFVNTKDSWLIGNYSITSNQVNGVDSTSNTFQLADVCLVEDNEGQTRTPDFMLAGRDVAEEFVLCQRYYEVGLSMGGSDSSNGSIKLHFATYKTTKRAQSFYTSTITNINGGGDSAPISALAGNTYGVSTSVSSGAGTSTGRFLNGNFTADAEL